MEHHVRGNLLYIRTTLLAHRQNPNLRVVAALDEKTSLHNILVELRQV